MPPAGVRAGGQDLLLAPIVAGGFPARCHRRWRMRIFAEASALVRHERVIEPPPGDSLASQFRNFPACAVHEALRVSRVPNRRACGAAIMISEPEWQTSSQRIEMRLRAMHPAWRIMRYVEYFCL